MRRRAQCGPASFTWRSSAPAQPAQSLAAELHRTTREMVAYGLDRIDPERDIRILLIEAAERVLPELPDRISAAARRLLDEKGIEVHTGARVTEVTAEGLRLADGSFIPSELVVWAAGVKAPEVLRRLDGLEVNRINQLVVEPTLQTTRDPDIFAIGDCAACPRRGEPTPVPPRAQAAHQQAAHMVLQIRRRLRDEPLLPYTYRDFGSLVSLGKYSTVGKPDGVPCRPQHLHRGSVCPGDVPLAAPAARAGAARRSTRHGGLPRAQSVATYWPAGQAALGGARRRRKDR